jgi:hypothetical protein
MTNLKSIAATVLALVLAGPAMAQSVTNKRLPKGDHNEQAKPREPDRGMTATDFNHQDLGIAKPEYHSGDGGPYGDGNYPGSVDRKVGPPRRER